MSYRLLLCSLCLAALLAGSLTPRLASAHSPAAKGGGLSVAITSGGVRLTLTLPGSTYGPNALVPVTVKLANTTKKAIRTWDCPTASLGVESIGAGRAASSAPLLPPGAPWQACAGASAAPTRHPVSIPPHGVLSRTTYLILRAPQVRAWAQIERSPRTGKPLSLNTPPLRPHPVVRSGPTVSLRVGKDIHAIVRPVAGAGPLLATAYAYCTDRAHRAHPSDFSAVQNIWGIVRGTVLRPFGSSRCTALQEWSLFVGQAGRPVAHVEYCPQQKRCSYAGATPQNGAVAACKLDVAHAIQSGKLPRQAAQYAVGTSTTLPKGLTPKQRALAQSYHSRCYPALHPG